MSALRICLVTRSLSRSAGLIHLSFTLQGNRSDVDRVEAPVSRSRMRIGIIHQDSATGGHQIGRQFQGPSDVVVGWGELLVRAVLEIRMGVVPADHLCVRVRACEGPIERCAIKSRVVGKTDQPPQARTDVVPHWGRGCARIRMDGRRSKGAMVVVGTAFSFVPRVWASRSPTPPSYETHRSRGCDPVTVSATSASGATSTAVIDPFLADMARARSIFLMRP